MRPLMNSRAVVIAIVALFALCFVGSGAVMALVLAERVATGQKALPEPKRKEVVQKETTAEPAPEATVDDSPDDDEVIETLDDSTRPEGAASYDAPVLGYSQFAIFFPSKPKVAPWAALQKVTKGTKLKPFKSPAPTKTKLPIIELKEETTLDYAVIEGDSLEKGRGLSDDDKSALPKAKTVAVFNVLAPVSVSEQLEVAKVMAALTEVTGGVLWDEQTQEYFSADAFRERRVDGWEKGVPWAALHFSVFLITPDKGGLEFATAGLRRFGLPELELRGVSRNSRVAGNRFVNVVAQALAESGEDIEPGRFTVELAKIKHSVVQKSVNEGLNDGAKGKVVIELRPIGDGEIPTLEITFPGEGAKTVRTERGLSTFFGAEDSVKQIKHDDGLEKLSKEQMAVFSKTVKPRFQKGLKDGEVLLVKAPFKTSSGGNEWMWVEVSRISANGNVTGLLANEPDDVPGLESGAEVVVKEAQLFDWLVKEADGSMSGNKTSELIEKMQAGD